MTPSQPPFPPPETVTCHPVLLRAAGFILSSSGEGQFMLRETHTGRITYLRVVQEIVPDEKTPYLFNLIHKE
jgi:hypothetical protein